ncbi:MAG TPA: PepSY domain-containing protein [Segeticoccus sp.]|nr:PepSY domain-containing protein [Segeticoccus sp.]
MPHSTLVSVESEQGGARWEGQVVTSDGTEHEMDMSRSGRKVISGPTKKREDAHDRAKHRSRVQAAEFDYRQAARKIASAVPGGHITELGLDSHRGKTVWEADVIMDGTKHEVTLDAKTGKVVLNRAD